MIGLGYPRDLSGGCAARAEPGVAAVAARNRRGSGRSVRAPTTGVQGECLCVRAYVQGVAFRVAIRGLMVVAASAVFETT